MARSYEDITAAQNALNGQDVDQSTHTLPPGYVKGFRFTINNDEKLTVGEGVVDVRGERVDTAEYVVTFEDYTQPDFVINNLNYYLYLNKHGDWLIDTLASTFSTDFFGYYHPVLRQYRYIGTFKLDTDGKYIKAVSEDPLRSGGVETGFLSTLFLNTDETIIIGYSNTEGINTLPEANDRRIFIDNDEIGFEEYIGTGWSTVDGIKIGGAVAGVFLSMIGCTGIYNPGNPPTSVEYPPHTDALVADLDGDLNDQYGNALFDATNSITYVADTKFTTLTQSLTHDGTAAEGYVERTGAWTAGDDMTLSFWFKCTNLATWAGMDNIVELTGTGNDYIKMYRIPGDNRISTEMGFGGSDQSNTHSFRIVEDQWHFVTLKFNVPGGNALKLFVSFDGVSDDWQTDGTMSGDTCKLKLSLHTNNNANSLQVRANDFLWVDDVLIDNEVLLEHYYREVPWDNGVAWTKDDILLRPDTDGKVYVDGNFTFGGILGLGVSTFHDWNASYDAGPIEWSASSIMTNNTEGTMYFLTNAYFDSGGYKYLVSDGAARLVLADNFLLYSHAADGTKDNAITWTSALEVRDDKMYLQNARTGTNQDTWIYFASDAYMVWDESESSFSIRPVTEYFTITSTAALGLGIAAPDMHSWNGNYDKGVIEWSAAAIMTHDTTGFFILLQNAYFDTGTNWKYTVSDGASLLQLGDDGLRYLIAGSGTADTNISWSYKFEVATNNIYFGGARQGDNQDVTMYFASDAWIEWKESSNYFRLGKSLIPAGAGTYNLGHDTEYWNDINYKTLDDRGGMSLRDKDFSYNLIKNLENETENGFCKKIEDQGMKRLKYSMFPDTEYDAAEKILEEDLIYNEEEIADHCFIEQNIGVPKFKKGDVIAKAGERTRYRKINGQIKYTAEGLSLGGYIDYIVSALRKVIDKVEALEAQQIRRG